MEINDEWDGVFNSDDSLTFIFSIWKWNKHETF